MKLYLLAIVIGAFNVASIGFLAPMLISQNDWLSVILGCAVALTVLPIDTWYINKMHQVFENYLERIEHEDK